MKTKLKTKTFTVSLPEEFYNKLEDLSKKDERSKNYYVKKALESYLEDLYFSKRAEETLHSGIVKTYSLEEIRKKYDL